MLAQLCQEKGGDLRAAGSGAKSTTFQGQNEAPPGMQANHRMDKPARCSGGGVREKGL